MGIAVIGSIGAAVYRRHMAAGIPEGLSAEQIEVASDTLGGALGIVDGLPAELAQALLAVVQTSFAEALHVNALIGAAIMAGTALLTWTCLRKVKLAEGGH